MITAELYSELKKITAEEARILNGDTKIETAIYMSQEPQRKDAYIVDAKKLLDAGKLIQVRPHTRFVHFPRHTHIPAEDTRKVEKMAKKYGILYSV